MRPKEKKAITLREIFDRYGAFVGAIITTAIVAGFVAHGIAGNAEKKADQAIGALDAVAQTQLELAKTQSVLAIKVAKTEGTVEGVLVGLKLSPQRLDAYLRLPRLPKMALSDTSKILCDQIWLYSSKAVDTLIIMRLDDNCQVSAIMIHPDPRL